MRTKFLAYRGRGKISSLEWTGETIWFSDRYGSQKESCRGNYERFKRDKEGGGGVAFLLPWPLNRYRKAEKIKI